MKPVVFIIAGLLFTMSVHAQEYYYYSNKQQIHFSESDKWIVVQISEEVRPEFVRAVEQTGLLQVKEVLNAQRGVYWLEIRQRASLNAALNRLRTVTKILRTIPAYFTLDERGDTARFIMTDEFHVKFHPHVTRAQIEQLNAQYGVEIIGASIYDEYILRVIAQSTLNTLELAKQRN